MLLDAYRRRIAQLHNQKLFRIEGGPLYLRLFHKHYCITKVKYCRYRRALVQFWMEANAGFGLTTMLE